MRKLLLSLALVLMLSAPVVVPASVHAIDVIDPICVDENNVPLPEGRRPSICSNNKSLNAQGDEQNPLFGPEGILTIAANILSFVVGIAAIISIIISAIRLIMSGGEPNAISGARRGILFAVIGLIIAAIAQLLVQFVLSKVPG